MYNRYIPGSTGVYERRTVEEPKKDLPCSPQPIPAPLAEPRGQQEQTNVGGGPFHMDLGDLLLLCVVLLLLVDCQEEDWSAIMVMAAAFLLMQ